MQFCNICKSQHLVPEDNSNLQVTAVCVPFRKPFKLVDRPVMMYLKGVIFICKSASFFSIHSKQTNKQKKIEEVEEQQMTLKYKSF